MYNSHSSKFNFQSPDVMNLQMSFLAQRYVVHAQSSTVISSSYRSTIDEAASVMRSAITDLIDEGHVDVGGAVYDRFERRVVTFARPVGRARTKYGRSMLALLTDPEWLERCIENTKSYVRGTPSKRDDGTDIWSPQA